MLVEGHQVAKQLRWQWIPSHRIIRPHHTKEEKKDLRCNDALDKPAKAATQLPLPEPPKGGVDSVLICNTAAPTPAKKWIMGYRHEATWGGTR